MNDQKIRLTHRQKAWAVWIMLCFSLACGSSRAPVAPTKDTLVEQELSQAAATQVSVVTAAQPLLPPATTMQTMTVTATVETALVLPTPTIAPPTYTSLPPGMEVGV